jgi:hypothetical protein
MDNVQNCDGYFNVPSSQTYNSYNSVRCILRSVSHGKEITHSEKHLEAIIIIINIIIIIMKRTYIFIKSEDSYGFHMKSRLCPFLNKMNPILILTPYL